MTQEFKSFSGWSFFGILMAVWFCVCEEWKYIVTELIIENFVGQCRWSVYHLDCGVEMAA